MPTVWFIRHAESEANAGQPTLHPATIKLTSKGFGQASSIASFFKSPLDLIITSPYIRTLETARPTLQRFPHTRHEEWPVEEFTYLASLDTFTTSLERKPMVDAFWQIEDPFYIDGENVESFITFMSRVQHTMKRLKQTQESSIAIFSHEQFIRAIMWLFFKGKMETGSHLYLDSKKQFKDFLDMFPLPNGAILPIQLQRNGEIWISNVITSHL